MIKSSLLTFAVVLVSLSSFAERVRLLADDKEALQARVDIIQQAKSEILVEYFSVWNDDQSVGAIALLVEAAQRGVKVKIVLDALSNTVPRPLFAALMEKGIDSKGQQNLELKVYNPISFNIFQATHRTHSKMLIVDGKLIITGGRNVGDKYFGLSKIRNFHDLDLIIDGDVVSKARNNFLTQWSTQLVQAPKLYEYNSERLNKTVCASTQDYELCEQFRLAAVNEIENQLQRIKDRLAEILSSDVDDIVQNQTGKDWMADAFKIDDIRFLAHDPSKLVTKKSATMTYDLINLLNSAQQEIEIVSPYLIPTKEVTELFKNLLDRGIKLKIITNSARSTDNMFAQAGYRKHRKELIAMGIELYEYIGPNTLHAKAAVIDQRVSIISTFNFDPRSAFINREVGMSIHEPLDQNKFAKELLKSIKNFQDQSLQVGHKKQEMNLEDDDRGLSENKLFLLKSVNFLLPVIEHQL